MTNSAVTAFAEAKGNYEIKQIRLSAQILHIGSEVQQLNPFEYVQTSSRVYLPDTDALWRSLRQAGMGFFNDYLAAVEAREPIAPILEQAFGENWATATTAEGRPLFPRTKQLRKWTESSITDLRPMIRDGLGRLYIPGSSIKGALRTAIAYHLLAHAETHNLPHEQQLSALEQTLRERLNDQPARREHLFMDDKLFMDELFANFDLTYLGKSVPVKQTGPNTDWLRALQVSDSAPLIEKQSKNARGRTIVVNQAIVPEVLVSSHFEDGLAKYRASLYPEMVWNVSTTFTIKLDQEMLRWFRHRRGLQLPFQTIDQLLQICAAFAQEQWNAEYDYWMAIKNNSQAQGQGRRRNLDFGLIRDRYEVETCPHTLRLGWGTGMNGTTIDLLLAEDLYQQVRDVCGIRAPGFEAPKSRRTVLDREGEIRFAPGWVTLKAKN